MDERGLLDRDTARDDHWDTFAEAMDLTIEGHRLIADEIAYETKLLWRGAIAWVRDMLGATHSSPPL